MVVMFVFVRRQFVLVYLDDIVVFLKLSQDRIEEVTYVLRLLYKTGVFLKFNECKVVTEIIKYLSHVIRHGRLWLVERTTDNVPKLEHPTT